MAHVSVRERKDGTKSYRVKWRDPDGVFRERTFKTKKEAQTHAVQVESDKSRGNYHDDRLSRQTFREVAEEWLITKTRAKERTTAEYRRILDKRLLPFFGNCQIGSLKAADSAAFVRSLMDDGLKAQTIARLFGQYKSVILYALDQGYITNRRALNRIDLPTDATLNHEQFQPRFLTVAELDRLAEAAAVFHPDYRLLVLFLGMTGLRAGECAALTVGDLRLYLDGRAEVSVSKTAQYMTGAGIVTTAPKTRTSVRTVTLPPSLAAEMRAYVERHPARGEEGVPTPADAPLWCGRVTGGAYTADWAPTPSESKHRGLKAGYRPLNPAIPWEPGAWSKSVWSRAVKMAGLEPLRLHDLRHTAASLALASGMNMHEVAAQLGHANSSITATVYAHLLPSEVIRSSERYDAWVAAERQRAELQAIALPTSMLKRYGAPA